MRISQILDKVDEKQLFVPAFQREYVWKRDDAKKLIFSLIKNYPTGSMLTWETNNPPELKGDWKYNSSQGSVKIILDGQQRITTLYLLIRNNIPPFYKTEEINNDPRGLYININNFDLQYYKKTIMDNNPYWVNISDIFQKKIRDRDIRDALITRGFTLSRFDEDRISDNFNLVQSIPDKEFLEQSVPINVSLVEAINIFYMVNASGVNLTDAELALAQISGYWPKARELFKKKLDELKEYGFELKLDFIVYCLLGILYGIGSDMVKLHSDDNEKKIKEAWSILEEKVLDYAINLLKTQAYVDHSKEINSIYALIPMIVYIYNKNCFLKQSEIKHMIKWFYYSQIRQRYVSQLPQKLDKDINIVNTSETPFVELLNQISLERSLKVIPEEFEGVDVRNALFSLMRWYFKYKGAVCLTTGVGIRQNMGYKYSLEWDHIFPYSVLTKHGYDILNRKKYSLAQEITNRAVLTQLANRTKSDKMAFDYLKQVRDKYPEALKLQCIPEDESLWQLDKFEDFLIARRKILATEINKYLDNIVTTSK